MEKSPVGLVVPFYLHESKNLPLKFYHPDESLN
jgi:hypothetical protein